MVLLLSASVAYAITAGDGAERPSVDAKEECDARRLEMQYLDLATASVESVSTGGATGWQSSLGPTSLAWSASTAVLSQGSERHYRITTGTGRIVTAFEGDRAIDAEWFWEHVGRPDVFRQGCEALISPEDYDERRAKRSRALRYLFGAAAASHGIGIVALALAQPDTTAADAWDGPERLTPEPKTRPLAEDLAVLGTAGGVALGVAGTIVAATRTTRRARTLWSATRGTSTNWSLKSCAGIDSSGNARAASDGFTARGAGTPGARQNPIASWLTGIQVGESPSHVHASPPSSRAENSHGPRSNS